MRINGPYNPYAGYRYGFGFIDTIRKHSSVALPKDLPQIRSHRDTDVEVPLHAQRIRNAINAIYQVMLDQPAVGNVATPTSAVSAPLGLDQTTTYTTLQSTEEINTIPTSFATSGSKLIGSTAQVTLGGVYDGSNGTQTLTFTVNNAGTHGEDDLQIKVFDENQDEIDKLDIKKGHALDRQYTLSNGITLTLGAGDLTQDDRFTIDVSAGNPTSFTPQEPEWIGSTALVTVGGVYDGAQGTTEISLVVDNGGTHGVDDLKVKVFDQDGQHVQDIDIGKDDPLDQVYNLFNGLNLTVGEGTLLAGTRLNIDAMEAAPTDLDGYQPEWTGNGQSTAQVTLNGTYDGSGGTGTFTFEVDRGGTHGEDNLRIKVYQPDNTLLQNINIDKNDPIDTTYTLSNGIELTLGAGDLVDNDSFTLAFTETLGSVVDPNNPFNGTGSSNPNFEPGLNVTDGAFTINGVTIDISGNDTVNSVLDRITASNAGVTATFDAASESILLTQKTPGAVPTVQLGNDTSGFLAATKLTGATPVPGSLDEAHYPLASVSRFAAVQDGTLNVNGVNIAIDTNTDSLLDVVDRINAANAGVFASYNTTTQKVSIVSQDSDDAFGLSSGTTNFFPALGIADGIYNTGIDNPSAGPASLSGYYVATAEAGALPAGVIQAKQLMGPDARMVGTLVRLMSDSMNTLFDEDLAVEDSSDMLDKTRNGIRSAVSHSFGSNQSVHNTDFGINFDFSSETGKVFNFSQSDQARFESALTSQEGRAAIGNLFFGRESNGLLGQLHNVLNANELSLDNGAGSTGAIVNTSI